MVQTWQAYRSTLAGLTFHPTGRLLATYGCDDPTMFCTSVQIWDPFAAAHVRTLATSAPDYAVSAIRFSPCGRYLGVAEHSSVASNVVVRVWQEEELVVTLQGMRSVVTALAFGPGDQPYLLSTDNKCVNWYPNPFTYQEAGVVRFNRGPDRASPKATRLAVSPCGSWVASTGRTKAVVYQVDPPKPKYVRTYPIKSPQNSPLAFRPDGGQLATAYGTRVGLWDFASGEDAVVELRGHKNPVHGLAYLPTGGLLSAASDGTVCSWHPDGSPRHTYDWNAGKIYTLTIPEDGSMAAAGTADGRILVWDLDG